MIIPEAVTFADAENICESVSGEVGFSLSPLDKKIKIKKLNSHNPLFQLYSADDPQFSPEALYQKLKTETDPVSENFLKVVLN